jgi:hypothetical protein
MGLVRNLLNTIRRIRRNLKHLPVPAYQPLPLPTLPFSHNREKLKSLATSDWEKYVRPHLPFVKRTLGIGRTAWVQAHVNDWMDRSSAPDITISQEEITV